MLQVDCDKSKKEYGQRHHKCCKQTVCDKSKEEYGKRIPLTGRQQSQPHSFTLLAQVDNTISRSIKPLKATAYIFRQINNKIVVKTN